MGQQEESKKIKPLKQPEGYFKLDREIYKVILNQCEQGDVSFIRSKEQKNIIFFGADFDTLNMKNLYKAMNVAKPDLVMVQLSPNYLLDNFEQHPGLIKDNKFEFTQDRYIDQLVREGSELYPSIKSKLNMHKLLRS